MRVGDLVGVETALEIDVPAFVVVTLGRFFSLMGAHESPVFLGGTDGRRNLGTGETNTIGSHTFGERDKATEEGERLGWGAD